MVDHEVINDGPLAVAVRDAIADEESTISEAFILGDDEIVSSNNILDRMVQRTMKGFDSERIHKESHNTLLDVAKSVSGSTQAISEIGGSDISFAKVVEPPYPPELMALFLEVSEVNFRSIRTKVTDSVGRDYILDSIGPVSSGNDFDDEEDEELLNKEQVKKEVIIINRFISACNEVIGFRGVIDRASMDCEAIGWAAIEVIRSRDMKIRKIAHIPATRIRVLRGWKGFIEVVDPTKEVYYQPFGEKVNSKYNTNPITEKAIPYDPFDDGDLNDTTAVWNMIDRYTGKPTSSFDNSANEVLWIPKHHSNTIYYGYTDVISAVGDILANVHIRDYLLQFFEHNTIPRYAIIIEGAKLADPVKKAIMEYFSTHVKGKAHKTLIIPIPSMRGEVKIRFEKLAADNQEGSFQETRKGNDQGIMTAHGVSPAIIGIADTASLGSGKGLGQAEIYKDRIVTPLQKNWADALSKLFRLGLGTQSVVLKFDPLDIRDRYNEMQTLTGYQDRGDLTINEIRKMAKLGGPIPGGNRAFRVVEGVPMFIDEMTDEVSGYIKDLEDSKDMLQESLEFEKKRITSEVPGNGQKPDVPVDRKSIN